MVITKDHMFYIKSVIDQRTHVTCKEVYSLEMLLKSWMYNLLKEILNNLNPSK